MLRPQGTIVKLQSVVDKLRVPKFRPQLFLLPLLGNHLHRLVNAKLDCAPVAFSPIKAAPEGREGDVRFELLVTTLGRVAITPAECLKWYLEVLMVPNLPVSALCLLSLPA